MHYWWVSATYKLLTMGTVSITTGYKILVKQTSLHLFIRTVKSHCCCKHGFGRNIIIPVHKTEFYFNLYISVYSFFDLLIAKRNSELFFKMISTYFLPLNLTVMFSN